MTLQPPPLPREHGAWAMLAIPLLVGLAASGRPVVPALLILPAMLLLFLARYAALPAATRLAKGRNLPEGYVARRLLWSAIYLAGSGLLFFAAVATAAPSASLRGHSNRKTRRPSGVFVGRPVTRAERSSVHFYPSLFARIR